MTWLQILAQAGVMATFVGAGIAVAAYFNGKHIKAGVTTFGEGITKLGEILAGIERTLAEMEKNAAQRHQEVVELLKKGFGPQLNVGH